MPSFRGFIEMGVKMSVERGMRQELERELLIDFKTGVYNFRYLTNGWLIRQWIQRQYCLLTSMISKPLTTAMDTQLGMKL